MIKIDLALAISLYISVFAVGILLIWIYLDRNKFKKYSSDDMYMWQCSVCMYAYVDSIHKEISVCPICGCYNKKGG
jgi:rRNA maturation endonuclease Nob1